MQLPLRTTTPPPRLGVSAPVGQTAAQGGGSQERHLLAANPVDSPPAERMRMPAQCQETFLCTSLAQARAQEWQPMHWSRRGVESCFMITMVVVAEPRPGR